MHETPSQHPKISLKELSLFQESNKELPEKRPPVPWKAIFSSFPMWAVLFAQVGTEMAFLLFLAYLPTYLSTILHFNIREKISGAESRYMWSESPVKTGDLAAMLSVGLLSAVPFVVLAITGCITSYIADALRISNILSITNIRKVFNSIGLFGPAVCLMIITETGCRPNLIVFLIILANGFLAFVLSGYNVTHVDMSPTFAATLYAITNTVGSCTGFIGPAIVGFFTSRGETMENWNIVFYITAGICAVTGLFFAIFASAELQDWQNEKEEKKSKLSHFTVK